MGYPRAFEMICLGEPFSAERALQAGLINAIVPADQLEATALKAAKRLAAKPREALMTSRRLLRRNNADISAIIDEEARQLHQVDGARPRPGKPSPPSSRSARPISPRPARRAADVRQKGGV